MYMMYILEIAQIMCSPTYLPGTFSYILPEGCIEVEGKVKTLNGMNFFRNLLNSKQSLVIL